MSQVETNHDASEMPSAVRNGHLVGEPSRALSIADPAPPLVQQASSPFLEAALISSRFLIKLSHEMRTPLNSILGVAQMMLETNLNDAQKEFAETVAESAQALASIAEAIANFSKYLEVEQVNLQTQEIGLSGNESKGSVADAIAIPRAAALPSPEAQEALARTSVAGNRSPKFKTANFHTRVSPATAKMVRILLAEDHVINQRVMLRMLARLGYTADAVSNGAEAVAALTRHPYDIVLMDCQMPELDGYEATRQIRQSGGRFQSTPIIAVTANAMEGDREKCLAAGMSDYISKPVLAHALAATLEKWILPASAAQDPSPSAEPARALTESQSVASETAKTAPAEVADSIDAGAMATLRSMDAGDEAFLLGIIELFLSDLTERLAGLKTAAETRDGAALKSIAHALKGSCGHFGATRLAALCRKMGQIAALQPVGDASGTFLELEAEAGRVRIALEAAKTSHSQIP